MRRKNNKDISKTITDIKNVYKKIDDISRTIDYRRGYYSPVYSRTRFYYSDITSYDIYRHIYNIFRDETV